MKHYALHTTFYYMANIAMRNKIVWCITVAKPGTKSCGVKLPIYQGPIPKYLKIEGVLQKSCGVS
jgi:hypothetical protein